MPYAFTYGSGTELDPYQVWTADDLNAVREYLDAHFIQMADIDLSGVADWIPIGDFTGEDYENAFSGSYDGNGYKISNLTVLTGIDVFEGGHNYLYGLFGACVSSDYYNWEGTNPVILKNITLDNIKIEIQEIDNYRRNVGGLAAIFYRGIISNCSVSGNFNCQAFYIGGFVGYGYGTTIENSFSSCFMPATDENAFLYVASIMISQGESTITNCYSNGTGANWHTGGKDYVAMGPGAEIVSSYYDSDVAGIITDTMPDEPGYHVATPKTTAEMKQQSTYDGWDFDTVWGIDPAINDGYPYLLVFSQAEPEEPIIDDVIPSYVPQSSIKLTFTAGDSDPYDMGTYYADKSQYKVSQDTTKINARNSIGKYLKDQSFDEDCNFAEQEAADLIESILSVAGLTNYYVADDSTLMGFNFSPNKKMLEGIEEIIQYLSGWQIREEFSGKTVVAKYDNTEFTQPSTYTFQRNRDIFSREQVTDDRSVYGRICVHTSDFSVKVYRPITSNLGWTPPARKTLYQEVPDGTTSLEAAAIATDLATSMADTGRVETLICAFRPQIIPGDGAEILDSTGAVSLGTITQVKHTFGIQGFYTEIVVDSGGKIGKIKFKDIVNSLQPLPATVKT